MRLDPDEIRAIADALAPAVADLIERRLAERPEWAFSVAEAAAWADVSEDAIRHALKSGKLRRVKVGHNLRIPRADLLRLQGGHGE